ncbi:hypothetical protein TTHERM_00658900 (macronuclear) [Tetrahymena thermophila SB210]|uniref:Uncharacterized protein n=1 Tax=Tetrahymena thermophila (strain SB210) TaxID=312017 RepID=I7LX65_TETTS|nr:hypothetical protein TTHERM_00658900 [Tetrahymena thermophila SB210]EAS03846.2 hypothetical protein TTHERM_00658900 [Tetrahymena thermophila SB210]|eukprot:XP_001024091.2 hypothetical protein TTHERM_00658900 [Tetrahymena thermophila SB210]
MVNIIKLQLEYESDRLYKDIEDFALDFCNSINMKINTELYYKNNRNIYLIQLHYDMISSLINEQACQKAYKFEDEHELDILNEYAQAFALLFKDQIQADQENIFSQFLNELQNNEYIWLFQIYHLIPFEQIQENKYFEIFNRKIKDYVTMQNFILGKLVDQERNGQPMRSRSDDDMGNLSKIIDVSFFERISQEQQEQIQQLMRKEEELHNEISKLKQQIDSQNNQMKDQEKYISILEKQNSDLQDENHLKSDEMNRQSLHLKDFQNLKEETEKQSEALQQSNKKIKMMEEQIRQSQEELQTEKRRADNLHSKLKDLDQIKQYQSQITELKTVNQNIQQKVESYQKIIEQQKHKLEKEVKEKQQIIDQIKTQKTQMQIEIEEKQSMIQRYLDTIEQNENEKIKLSQKINEYEYTYLDQKKEIESLKCQIIHNSDKQNYMPLENSPTKLDLEILGVQSRKSSLNYTGQNINNQGQNLSRFNNSNFKLSNKLQDIEGNFESPLSSQRSNMGSSRQTDNLSLNQQLELIKEKEDTINIYKNKLREQSDTISNQLIEIQKLTSKLKEAELQSNQNIPTNLIDISREYRRLMSQLRQQEQELDQLNEELSNEQKDREEEQYEFDKKIMAQQQLHKIEILQKDEEIKLLTSAIYELRMEHIQRQNNQRLKTFLKKLQIDQIQDTFSTEISTQSSSH